MTDKVQKIREEVERLKGWNNNVRNSTRQMTLQEEDFNRGKHSSYLEILDFIDSMQKESKKCMYANDNYTDEEMKGLCKDCDEECWYAKKEKYFDPISLAHKWDKEFDELLKPYKDSRNYKNLYIRLRYWKQNCKREFLWKWKYKKEEHVSEEIEEELNSYLERVKATDKDIDFVDFARYFAKWQKQQMMKDATDVTVHIDTGNYPYIPQLELYDYDNDVALAKEGDKYKVVLIKEE